MGQFNQLVGSQTIEWADQEMPVTQLEAVLARLDRSKREQAWRLGLERRLVDRAALNHLWQ